MKLIGPLLLLFQFDCQDYLELTRLEELGEVEVYQRIVIIPNFYELELLLLSHANAKASCKREVNAKSAQGLISCFMLVQVIPEMQVGYSSEVPVRTELTVTIAFVKGRSIADKNWVIGCQG